MGVFSKLAFWKKKDDFSDLGLGKDFDLGKDDFGMKGGDMGMGKGTDLGAGFGDSPDTLGMSDFDNKKSQDFSLDAQRTPGAGMQQGFQQQAAQQQYPQPQYQYAQPNAMQQDTLTSKNIEILSYKIDTLRVSLESINQRLANIERIASGQEEEPAKKRRGYY